MADVATEEPIRIFPNPAGKTVYVTASGAVTVSVSSTDGKVLLRQDHAEALDISHLYLMVFMILSVSGKHGHILRSDKLVKISGE